MPIRVDVADEIPGTAHFDFVYGRFQLSSWSIPYFCTTMTARQAADSLKLVHEFPGWEENNWTLEELFQREIDWRRVTQRIVPYLKNRDHPQFFNSITVALLPQLGGRIVSYEEEGLRAPPLQSGIGATEHTVAAGPLNVGYWGKWSDLSDRLARFGTLRWNPHQTFGVAIDGQHRLAALKEFAGTDKSDDTLVPVILLVFHPSLGYGSPKDERDILPLLRSLFIDLNKHAVKVSRSRLILLDDRDPTAVCVRALVGERLADDLGELKGSPPVLPLSLIDWHSDSAKFDHGPYLGTILGLDWMIQRALGIRPVQDYTDYGKILSQLRALKRTLDVDLTAARNRLAEAREFQRPFNYDDGSIEGEDELQKISEAFKSKWNPAIVHLLTAFEPYHRLVQARKATDSTDAVFVQWYQLFNRLQEGAGERPVRDAYADLELRLNEGDVSAQAYKNKLDEVEKEKAGSLAFNVVFQRALFLSFADYEAFEDEDLWEIVDELAGGERGRDGESLLDPDEEELEEFYAELESEEPLEGMEEDSGEPRGIVKRSQEFVRAMNDLVERWPDFLDVRVKCDLVVGAESEQFWLGTLWKAEQSIDFTQGASARAKVLLNWAVGVWALREAGVISEEDRFEGFWKELVKDRSRDDAIHRFLHRATKDFQRKTGASKSAAARIAGDEADEADLERVAMARFGQLFAALLK